MINIVRFNNGSYGIRKRTGFLFKTDVYFDLETTFHWWNTGSPYFKDCQSTSLQRVTDIFNNRGLGIEVVEVIS